MQLTLLLSPQFLCPSFNRQWLVSLSYLIFINLPFSVSSSCSCKIDDFAARFRRNTRAFQSKQQQPRPISFTARPLLIFRPSAATLRNRYLHLQLTIVRRPSHQPPPSDFVLSLQTARTQSSGLANQRSFKSRPGLKETASDWQPW